MTYPTSGASVPVGSYSEGCIAGAKALPLEGEGFQVMRPSRNRYYGHPELLQFIQDLARTMNALGAPLLIGDLGQPRGGPLPYGHASHQIGLDVDIWFWSHPEQETRSLNVEERETLPMLTVLNPNGVVDPNKFGREQILKLKMASLDEHVQRIFVNPAIKVYLCSTLAANEHEWLHKLRPWPGHDEHFHVRLFCPPDSKECVTQAAVPEGDGCTEVMPKGPLQLESSGGGKATDEKLMNFIFKPGTSAAMPARCAKILKQ